jgi:ubiquitin carboxyl-terminal hydrolase L5
VFGLIFLFKYQASPLDAATQTLITPDNPLNDSIYFARQMITNACGTQAILNLLLNLDEATCAKHGIKLGEELKNFKEFTHFLPADVSSCDQ